MEQQLNELTVKEKTNKSSNDTNIVDASSTTDIAINTDHLLNNLNKCIQIIKIEENDATQTTMGLLLDKPLHEIKKDKLLKLLNDCKEMINQ